MKQHIILVLMWTKARKLQGTQDPLPPPSGSLFFSKSELQVYSFQILSQLGSLGRIFHYEYICLSSLPLFPFLPQLLLSLFLLTFLS